MLGHFLLSLTDEEADRVLTTRLRPGDYGAEHHRLASAPNGPGACVMGAAKTVPALLWEARHNDHKTEVEGRYDALYERFGERVNVAIRNRLLALKAARQLTPARRCDAEVALGTPIVAAAGWPAGAGSNPARGPAC